MGERKQIALIYQYNDNWIGGTYYIINIIKTLMTLNDSEKPDITLIYNNKDSLEVIENIHYPHIRFLECDTSFSFFGERVNNVFFKLFGRYVIKKRINANRIKNLYPSSLTIDDRNVENAYYWIPDFQERYLPQFFLSKEIEARKNYQTAILRTENPIVFSSEVCKRDFEQFYPEHQNKKYVLPFVSIMSDQRSPKTDASVIEKFNITKPYFIVCNQFWKHKNHQVVLDALLLLKKNKELDFQVVFTGKEEDYRNPDFIKGIKEFVADNKLHSDVHFFGFISRSDQIALINESLSVIQPSLFEGWSTVVEDCKALGKFIILSKIPVHQEQIKDNCLFFDVNDSLRLSKILSEVAIQKPKVILGRNDEYVRSFAKKFVSIFN